MRFTTLSLSIASLVLLALSACVKFERDCGGVQVNAEACPAAVQLGTGTGSGTGTGTATLERPLALTAGFGVSGFSKIDIYNQEDISKSILKQPSGKLVVVGHSKRIMNDGVTRNAVSLVRLDATTGVVDTTFAPTGLDGKVWILDPSGDVVATGGAVARGNGSLIVGYTVNSTPTDTDFALRSFTQDGMPETALPAHFDFPPVGSTVVSPRLDVMNAITIDSSRRLIMAGHTNSNGGETRIGVIRLQADSNTIRDASFAPIPSGNGMQATYQFSGSTVIRAIALAGEQSAKAIALDSTGRILLAGSFTATGVGQTSNMFVMRLDRDGLLDSHFQNAPRDFSVRADEAKAIVIQSDNKIVVGGYVHGLVRDEFALMRVLEVDGSIDTSFGVSGKVQLDLGSDAQISSLQMQGSKILAFGQAAVSSTVSTKQTVLVRFNSDGKIDTTFGSAGVMRFGSSFNGSPTPSIAQTSLWDGSALYVVGDYVNGSLLNDFFVTKLQ